MMKRTVFALGVSAMLAMPLLVNGQMAPSTPGAGGSGTRMEQEERRGQMDVEPQEVREAQERLKEAGFNPGPVDGQLGAQTKSAIKQYQKAHGLSQTGRLDEDTREMLLAQKMETAPGRRPAPGGSTREGTMPGESMPGGRSSGGPGSSSTPPGGSGPSR
jgi:peptidoglycan hydrolase-like protein with peptidoglycan-binding domain